MVLHSPDVKQKSKSSLILMVQVQKNNNHAFFPVSLWLLKALTLKKLREVEKNIRGEREHENKTSESSR
jgi:hypothetical protein